MSWRWMVWSLGILLLALVLLMPLRIVVSATDLAQVGLSARQVAGTIWGGRIGDLMLSRQLLGTFDVRLSPGDLVLGRIAMPFERLASPDGPLTGVLRAGGSLRGVERLTGTLAIGHLLGAAPVQSLDLRQVTILFADGRCRRAEGRIAANLAISLGPLPLDRGFSGTLACEGERVRARLASPGGSERIEFYVNHQGLVRGWITVRTNLPGLDGLLAGYGFTAVPEGFSLPFETRL